MRFPRPNSPVAAVGISRAIRPAEIGDRYGYPPGGYPYLSPFPVQPDQVASNAPSRSAQT